LGEYNLREDSVRILTSDDLTINDEDNYYDYYSCDENEIVQKYDEIYKEKSLKLSQINNKSINDYSYDDTDK
jgi:hypothetical protein